MQKDVVAVVLAGGIGKRFWPISLHKSMVSFLGKPLIVHNLEMLKKIGLTRVVVVVPKDETELSKIGVEGMDITIAMQSHAEGMGDAVLRAKKFIGISPSLIMGATDVVDEALYESMKRAMQKDEMFVVGKKVAEYFDGGYLKLESNRVVEVVEKPGKGNTPSDLVNLVFHYFPNPSVFFDALAQIKSDKDDVYERALSHVLEKEEARVLTYDGYWQPLKYSWQVLDSMEYVLKTTCRAHTGKNVEITSNVVIEGAVYIEDNVRIFENTKIVGPCYIGKNTIVGNNNIIRHSHIGADCVTGFNTDITRSYVGDNCWFHSNYIGDSVLEGNISMGSGSVLANLRLDEGDIYSVVRGEKMNTGRNKLGAIIGRDVRIGVNTSIMPGVKIGKHSRIGAGMVIDKDIPDDSFCVTKSTYVMSANTHMTKASSRDEFKKRL